MAIDENFQRQLLKDAYLKSNVLAFPEMMRRARQGQGVFSSAILNPYQITLNVPYLVKGYDGYAPLTSATTKSKSHKFIDLPDEFRRFLIPNAKIYKSFVSEENNETTLRLLTDPENDGTNRVELENIDFVRLGGNPAEIDTNIDFNITLSAREIGFLFKKQFPQPEESTNVDEVAVANGVQWIDLIKIDPGKPLEIEGSERVVNEKNTRMKVVLGYSMPATAPTGIDPDLWLHWRNIIKSQSETFFLNLKKHSFDFKSSGEISLSVNFVASAEAAALSPGADLLNDPFYKERMKNLQKSIKESRKAKRDLEKLKLIDTVDEKVEAVKELLNREQLAELADRITRGLTNDANLDAAITACIEELGTNIDDDTSEIQEYSNKCKIRLLNQIYLSAGNPHTNSGDKITRVAQMGENAADPDEPSYGYFQKRGFVNDEANFVDVRGSDLENLSAEGEGAELVTGEREGLEVKYFTTLGSIIEGAMEIVADNLRLGAASTTTDFSNFVRQPNLPEQYIMPFSETAFDAPLRNQQYSKRLGLVMLSKMKFNNPANINEKIEISLRNLPISLVLFRTWWLSKVKNKRSFYLKDFFSSLMNDFVKNHVFSPSVYDEIDREDVEFPSFIINSVQLPTEFLRLQASSSVFKINEEKWDEQAATRERQMIEQGAAAALSPLIVIQQSSVPEVATDKEAKFLWGQATRGIMEKVQFKRADIPGFAEARLFSEDDGMANNMMLREKYNVDITTLGTTMLLPGSIFRLDPSPLDLGFEEEAGISRAKSLGLGGRYCTHSIEHQLDLIKKEWTTRIVGKWESFSDGSSGEDATAGLLTTSQCLANALLPAQKARQRRLATNIESAANIREAIENTQSNPSLTADVKAQLLPQLQLTLERANARIRANGGTPEE